MWWQLPWVFLEAIQACLAHLPPGKQQVWVLSCFLWFLFRGKTWLKCFKDLQESSKVFTALLWGSHWDHKGTFSQKSSITQLHVQYFFRRKIEDNIQHFRNRKHVPCFYRVIQTRVEVWENEKCCGNTSRRRVFPQLFQVLPNFHECLYNSIETRSTCFLFLLENTATRKRKTTC